jgi:hypothetical protein
LTREPWSALAALLGYQPTSFAIDKVRSRVATDNPGRSFKANDTAPRETPAF